MENRLKHVSKKKDRLLISKRITRSSSKSIKIVDRNQIPVDLIIEILLKLPLKSIARFRCVSKDWNSILRSPEFTNLFLKISSSRPRLLFAVETKDTIHFFSTPQPLNLDKNSSPLTTDHHMCFPLVPCSAHLFAPVNGLLCTGYLRFGHGCNDSKVMIYNPSTGQPIQLPITRGRRDYAFIYFGYDPISQQYKVLCLSMRNNLVILHEVLTLGIEKPAWRMIECSLPRHFPSSPICINGVLYYLGSHGSRETLVCFNIRSEKFKFIETDDKTKLSSRLINYKGKLGVLSPAPPALFFDGKARSLELFVLDDVEKNEWSQHIYALPSLWEDLVAGMTLEIVGIIGNGELVFFSENYDPCYIFFYNVEKNTIAKVRIQTEEPSRIHDIQIYIDHVENVKLI